MRTTEIINGQPVTIDWEFEEMGDMLRPGWHDWFVKGQERLGSRDFTGNCEADESDPELLHDVEVTNVECVEYDLPANWEPDYGGSNGAERQEQMHEMQKLK